ncbi:hypothetical protein [Streptomyces sp. AK02-01A]|uniref:hypothetical protein n=1 Tax=Streptomyces sp. AK02-01A TaxID=3028648 RepID=UPI0029B3E75D|nr:hypothetical protein [Streptomyces sp. AK02-01A]MDX3851110.1 hypothetical protein [Streptomyces sp. AK02-01A]
MAIPQIPHTINAIGDVLGGAERACFHTEVKAAGESVVPAVRRRWWKTATLNHAPDAERSRANSVAGRNLVSVDELATQIEGADR